MRLPPQLWQSLCRLQPMHNMLLQHCCLASARRYQQIAHHRRRMLQVETVCMEDRSIVQPQLRVPSFGFLGHITPVIVVILAIVAWSQLWS